MHGDHGLGLEQARGMGGLQPVHREEAAHGQQRKIQRIQRTYQLHRREKAGIARMVKGKAIRHGHDIPCGGPGFRSVESLRHGDADALHFDGAADTAAGRAAAFADRHGVTRMIAVVMGDEHQIRLPGLIPRHGAGRVVREERIDENSHIAARNLKIGMTVPSNGNAHGILLKDKEKEGGA